MNKPNIAYLEITFTKKIKIFFSKIINEIVKPEYFYTSPVMPHINGDVTSKLHLTLLFGLDSEIIKNKEYNAILKKFMFPYLDLGKLFIMDGYQSLYKILCVEVLDPDKRLFKFSKNMENFITKEDRKNKEFKPHLTLAYVSSEFKSDLSSMELIKKIKTKSLKTSLF